MRADEALGLSKCIECGQGSAGVRLAAAVLTLRL